MIEQMYIGSMQNIECYFINTDRSIVFSDDVCRCLVLICWFHATNGVDATPSEVGEASEIFLVLWVFSGLIGFK